MKLLTISIAAYNVEKYLRKTLDSLLVDDDTLEKIEILIEDDGSKDGTALIGTEYEHKYPQSIKLISKENGGYGSTINTSIKIAQGKYFKQLDGDDWYKTENLMDFAKYLETCESDIVLTPFYEVREPDMAETLVDTHKRIPAQAVSIESCPFDEDVLMHEMAIRTELLRAYNIEISEHCFYTDNEYTFLPLLHANTISRFDKPIYCYRLGREGQSVSLTGVRKHYQDTMIVAKKIFKNYAEYGLNALGGKKNILETRVVKIADMVYGTYAVLEDKKTAKYELVAFDTKLKSEFDQIYMIINVNKKIRFLRRLKFNVFAMKCVEKVRLRQF